MSTTSKFRTNGIKLHRLVTQPYDHARFKAMLNIYYAGYQMIGMTADPEVDAKLRGELQDHRDVHRECQTLVAGIWNDVRDALAECNKPGGEVCWGPALFEAHLFAEVAVRAMFTKTNDGRESLRFGLQTAIDFVGHTNQVVLDWHPAHGSDRTPPPGTLLRATVPDPFSPLADGGPREAWTAEHMKSGWGNPSEGGIVWGAAS